MNYRHAFHAGNFADVFKHTALVALLDALAQKPTPMCYVDTHAGRGRYDLGAGEAARTGEQAGGVRRLLAAAHVAPLRRYLDLLRRLDPDAPTGTLQHYPGSPLLAAACLREQDRALLCELQPDEYAALRVLFRDDARVHVHLRDGYAALPALLPPPEKRGLVLIDPPYEAQDGEFAAIQSALRAAWLRWPQGVYAVWYPIKRRATLRPFQRWLTASGARKVLIAELQVRGDDSPLRMNGCGLAIVNAPFRIDATLAALLTALQPLLADGPGASQRLEWLTSD